MINPTAIKEQVDSLVAYMVEKGLSNDQNFSYQRINSDGLIDVTFPNSDQVAIGLKKQDYTLIYQRLVYERAYNVMLLDGALMQIMYRFSREGIQKHRLAFWSAPHLEDFQNEPEMYLEDEIYADVIARNIVPFPLRFDFDNYGHNTHPKTHLTLGQYENCRIPVTAPLTPYWFVDFILRNFYNTAFMAFLDSIPPYSDLFDETIEPEERSLIHVSLPV